VTLNTHTEPRTAPPPEMLDSQREALAALRARPEVTHLSVLSVRHVTDSIEVSVQISETGGKPDRAVIAPSGRIHRL
jgi:hypothetical protein